LKPIEKKDDTEDKKPHAFMRSVTREKNSVRDTIAKQPTLKIKELNNE
jgi:hypothetical protein